MQWEYSGTVQVTKNDTLVLYLSLFSSYYRSLLIHIGDGCQPPWLANKLANCHSWIVTSMMEKRNSYMGEKHPNDLWRISEGFNHVVKFVDLFPVVLKSRTNRWVLDFDRNVCFRTTFKSSTVTFTELGVHLLKYCRCTATDTTSTYTSIYINEASINSFVILLSSSSSLRYFADLGKRNKQECNRVH